MTNRRLTARAAALGALTGLLTGGLAIGVSYAAAGFTGADSGPVVAVGQLSIDQTPPAVKNFAIAHFGSNDKLVLLTGIGVVLAIFAAVVGILALRKLRYGMAGLAVFAAIGLIAAETRPDAGPADVLPTLIGAAAGALALLYLARAAGPLAAAAPVTATAAAGARPITSPRHGGRPASDAASPPPDAAEPPADAAWPLPDAAEPPADAAWPPSEAAGPQEREVPAPGEPQVPADTGGYSSARDSPAWSTWAGADDRAASIPRPAGYSRIERRRFINISAVAVGTAGVGYVAGRLLSERGAVTAAQRSLRLPRPSGPIPRLPPGVDLKIPGLSSFITPNSTFYRVDTAIVVPQIPPDNWSLRIHGMVRREIHLSFDDLIRRPLLEDYITLTCVSNPVAGPYVGNALWLGASLRSLLREAGIQAGADQLLCTSADGFTSGSPVQITMDGRDAMLAVAMNGTPLPTNHGFPVRMVVPGLYGYVSACKWITDIEVTTYSSNTAYWAQRGWSQQAPIKTESRIDVPNGSTNISAGATQIAGVAWAQHKGIDAVEVRVDKGPWQHARLAAVPGIDTWRQWAVPWDARPGTHTLEARATDATGYTQTALNEPPPPNGASGYPMVLVTVN